MTTISELNHGVRTGKLPRQFSARSRSFIALTVTITVTAVLASFTLSFNAQMAIAGLLQLGVLSPLLPVGVDTFILVSVLTLTLLREREGVAAKVDSEGRKIKGQPWFRTGQGQQWALLWLWTAASAGLNSWHAFIIAKDSPLAVQIALAAVGLLFPLGVLTATETLIKVLIRDNAHSQEKAALITSFVQRGGSPVAATASGRKVGLADQELAAKIQAELLLADGEVTLKEQAERHGVSVGKVKLLRELQLDLAS